MCAALIGGMTRLKREYIEAAKGMGVTLKFFDGNERSIAARVGGADAMILFTNKLSHVARGEALRAARAQNIPVTMVHSCGVSTLRETLDGLGRTGRDAA